MQEYFITEAVKNSKGKKYKCPYCDHRDYKEPLVKHIDKEHKIMIPKGFTSARLVFNIANKKDHGTCVCGCGKETAWREDLWRYDRYATDKCKEKYSKEMKQRMVKIYGKEHLLNDADMQNKMLSGRSISGVYKFSTGGKKEYVGTYEEKFLEFCDKVLNLRCSDIEQPGPVIEYKWNDETHFWITDYYIPAFNLVLDIKDGGSNPNTRDMEDYRAKQEKKEKAIADQNKYNYIRLTDNNFAQLMLIMAELKLRMCTQANETDHIIHINESTSLQIRPYEEVKVKESSNEEEYMHNLLEAMIGITPQGKRISDVYVVNYMRQGTFEDILGVSIGDPGHPNFSGMLTTDSDGEITMNHHNILDEAVEGKYKLYKFIGERKEVHKPMDIVEYVTGVRINDTSELDNDPRFKKVLPYDQMMEFEEKCLESTILQPDSVTIMTEAMLNNDGIESRIDKDGVFIINTETGLRTPSYPNEAYIKDYMINYIKGGKI